MMFFTRADEKLVLRHVIENVFELEADNTLTTALNQAGIISIGGIIDMHHEDIVNLTYTNDQGDKHPLKKGDRYRLRALKYYHLHRITTGCPIGHGWLSITREEFNQYRMSKDYDATLLTMNRNRLFAPLPRNQHQLFALFPRNQNRLFLTQFLWLQS